MIVRTDCDDSQHKLASYRRGCDALISRDNGGTWNLHRRYELDSYDYSRPDGYWVDGKCGHIGAVALDDGSIISVYGHYQTGAAVLIKWKPDAGPAEPAGEWEHTGPAVDESIADQVAQRDADYQVGEDGLTLNGNAWIHLPNHERLTALDQGTIEVIFKPEKQGGMPCIVSCTSVGPKTPVFGFSMVYDQRGTNPDQLLYSDQRVDPEQMEYSIMVGERSTPAPLQWNVQQLTYVVDNGHGRFYRDAVPFSAQKETSKTAPAALFKYVFDRAGGQAGVYIAIGAPAPARSVGGALRARLIAVRIYDRALTPAEMQRNRIATSASD